MGFFSWGLELESLAQIEIFCFNDQGATQGIMVK